MTAVTIVTQTRVSEAASEAFGRFQARISAAVAVWPGFLEQSVLPPKPPLQADWVILQRFDNVDAATGWLHAPARATLLADILPHIVGLDDVHLVRDEAAGVLPAPVSVVFTTRLRPGAEAAFRRWEQKMAAAQSRSSGFQGYRFETPVPGVQDDYVAILRFDSQASLQCWMVSPERQALLAEGELLALHIGSRVVQSGFSQWFPVQSGARAPAWKQNLIVLMLLYPVVFLFGLAVQTPLMMGRMGMPFWLALFFANAVSIVALGELVPRVSRLLAWWLNPDPARSRAREGAGAAIVAGAFAICLALFSRL